ncbi:N-acetyl-gamma-glutamyl-phosphate reductase, partial [Candidatus Micrarchaeota archaeon]|nr:N-acetyl-gamma-glutamyl-phosphate reductase [Candidatus Micrarchaeota archaeon]
VVDISADYRLHNPKAYEEWYKLKHKYPELLGRAVYGLPELHREEIKKARLVANPGCYSTGAILALAPLVKNRLVETEGITIDSKSGVSGAGKDLTEFLHSGEVIGNVKHYSLPYHRHVPEIEQELSSLVKKDVVVNLTPTLVPIVRGILTTAKGFATNISEAKVLSAYRKFYDKEPFVRVMEDLPTVANVVNTNYCDISFRFDKRTRCVVAISAIDNLLKGAAGQAVQNMNIMLGFEETLGLG